MSVVDKSMVWKVDNITSAIQLLQSHKDICIIALVNREAQVQLGASCYFGRSRKTHLPG
jgi:hypothetical protein